MRDEPGPVLELTRPDGGGEVRVKVDDARICLQLRALAEAAPLDCSWRVIPEGLLR